MQAVRCIPNGSQTRLMSFDPFLAADAAAAHLARVSPPPAVAVVLGSGLGAFAERLHDAVVVPYAEIPGFVGVGVVGHAGRLVVGGLTPGGPRVAALSGRVHLYEGHAPARVVHSVRTLWRWGVGAAVFTNAAGGIGRDLKPGDLMLITDHLNLTGQNPLTGPDDRRLGVRFPDMSAAYDPQLGDDLRAAAKARGVALKQGVYAGLAGPSYETPAEIRMLTVLGGDAVGMSTVHEVIAARHLGLRVAGISCITNLAAGLSTTPLDHAEVEATAGGAREAFIALLQDGLGRIAARVAPSSTETSR